METDEDRKVARTAIAGAMLHAIVSRGLPAGDLPRQAAVTEAFKLADEFMKQAEPNAS